MTEVMKSIDFAQQGIKLTYQFTPLSWHFYAFKIHQGNTFILFSFLLYFTKRRQSTGLKIHSLYIRNSG
jgi:hypothetical protein